MTHHVYAGSVPTARLSRNSLSGIVARPSGSAHLPEIRAMRQTAHPAWFPSWQRNPVQQIGHAPENTGQADGSAFAGRILSWSNVGSCIPPQRMECRAFLEEFV